MKVKNRVQRKNHLLQFPFFNLMINFATRIVKFIFIHLIKIKKTWFIHTK